MLELAHALLADAELAPQLLQRRGLLAQPALVDDGALALAQLAQSLVQPARPRRRIAQADHHLLRSGAVVGKAVLPFLLALFSHGSVQGLIGPGEARLHGLDLRERYVEGLGNGGAALGRHDPAGRLLDAGAQAAKIEEERLLGRGR